MTSYEIRTIACGHFIRRTSIHYIRTIACAVAYGDTIACGDPKEDFTLGPNVYKSDTSMKYNEVSLCLYMKENSIKWIRSPARIV
uniref:Uncharacterized protein n=1 Tax=Acrobeloides nanus TaxID=290746 RepID=A0A914CMS4_9BILA